MRATRAKTAWCGPSGRIEYVVNMLCQAEHAKHVGVGGDDCRAGARGEGKKKRAAHSSFDPLRQALMQLCHEGACLMALRTASRSFCGAAERRGASGPEKALALFAFLCRVGRTGNLPRWPLVLMITVDEFVSKHRSCLRALAYCRPRQA